MSLRAIAAGSAQQTRDFATIARALLVSSDGTWSGAGAIMQNWARRSLEPGGWCPSTKALNVIAKVAVDPAGNAAGSWGSALGDPDLTASISAFLGSLRTVGVFDRMIGDGAMLSVPLRSRYAIATSSLTATTTSAGSVKPLSSQAFSSDTATERKIVCAVVASNEFMRIGGQAATDVLDRELRGAVAYETDVRFLADIIAAGGSPVAASGTNAYSVRRDMQRALRAMTSQNGSRFYVVMRPTRRRRWLQSLTPMATPHSRR